MPNLVKLFWRFLLIGSTSFGGYMALIAMVRNRFVTKEKLIDDAAITEGIAIASVLPGPVAVNVVAYTGYVLAGVAGAIVSVIAVLIPSFFLITAFAVLYFNYGEIVSANAVLKGVIPVIVALLLAVAVTMGLNNIRKISEWVIVALAASVFLLFPGYGSIVGLFLLGAFKGIVLTNKKSSVTEQQASSVRFSHVLIIVFVFLMGLLVYSVVLYFFPEDSGVRLFSIFSSVSLTLFGGGYVMVPILKSILVDKTQWFTLTEFLAGISAGQITPGPILISAAFFGYKIKGVTGAVIATIAIFLPSSLLMILVSKFFSRYKSNRFVQAALAGIKPVVVGLILAAAFSVLGNYWPGANPFATIIILVVSFLLIFRFKINPVILVAISGLAGYLFYSQ
ncbi:MAG: chromate efflux transporter [Flammeovirgaceae bacterium]|nr:MAG: chromate efflux transporter [Flammeovirgaceae bacterium]